MPENEYVTKTDLKDALKESAEWTVNLILTEMGIRFGEVNQRLDRIDATLVNHGKQLASGSKIIASFNEWMGKADADYTRVLSELTDLKLRVAKLEHPSGMMSNTQLCIAVGLPMLVILAILVINLFVIAEVREDIREIRSSIKLLG